MKEKFEKWLSDNSITEVECLVADLGGIARGKILPTNKFIQGLENDSHRLPQSVFIQTISGGYATENEELPTDVYNPTDIDVILRPDYESIRSVPWYEDPTAQVICDVVNLNGTSVINSSRTVLKKILKLKIKLIDKHEFNKSRAGKNKSLQMALMPLFWSFARLQIGQSRQVNIGFDLFVEFDFDDYARDDYHTADQLLGKKEKKERIRKQFQQPAMKSRQKYATLFGWAD